MMKFYVYVILSLKNGYHYVGQTADLARRLAEHNSGATKSIKHLKPFKLIYTEVFDQRGDAMKRERFLKSGKGREWLKNYLSQIKA